MDETTMTEKQATARIEQLIQDTVAVLDPKPRLEIIESMSQPGSCVDPTDQGSPDRTVVSHSYWMRDIPRSRNGDIGQQAKRYWESKGYKITKFDGLNTNEPNINGYTQSDEFLFSIETNVDGDLNIGATSPCIWPNGTPEPSSGT
ncbi:MAG TPA: hypothetical protein VFU43_05155 [Streptosporangiaceae bacterium]|nr:hypothetical protein [Streptosporangiaceae bacterium]